MTVIAITKFRPHAGKANLVLQNMRDVVAEFEKMGMTARLSKDMLGRDAGVLIFSSIFNFYRNYLGLQIGPPKIQIILERNVKQYMKIHLFWIFIWQKILNQESGDMPQKA